MPILLLLALLTSPLFADQNKQLIPIERDEGKSGRALFGAITATVPGFGLGHAIQGRYSEKGWIFTGGEILGLVGGFAMLGIKCGSKNKNECNAAKAIGALLTFGTYAGLHIWETVDAWNWDPPYETALNDSPLLALRFKF